MDKVNSRLGWWLLQYRAVQMMAPSSSPARTLSSQRISASDGVGGMLGLASNSLDTLDAVRLDEAGRRRTDSQRDRPPTG
jgi:hypothetical protein